MTSSTDTDQPGPIIPFKAYPGSKQGNGPVWIEQCLQEKGKPLNVLANALIALRQDPLLSDAFALDEMLQAPLLMKPLRPEIDSKSFKPRPLSDYDVTEAQEILQRAALKRIGKDVMHQAIDRRAYECRFHPARQYLNSLTWDGTKRVSNWLSLYLGATQNAYAQAVGRMFLVSMIARVYQPGCKADYMLVLEGPQGARKSTACAILGGPWFSDNLPDVTGGKDVCLHLLGKWLIEIPEMSAVSKAEAAHLKAFITRTHERYRPPYGRKEVLQPRQCIFIGTTNQSIYLRDETGGRRFWPMTIGKIDSDALRQDRDQLFAEAVHLYLQSEPWHPTSDFEQKFIRPEQDARFEVDVWEEAIRAFLDEYQPKSLLVGDLLEKALHIDKEHRSTRSQRRVTSILQRLEWRRLKKDSKGNIPWGPPLSPVTDGSNDTDDTDDTDDISKN